jgi:Domain of unknown function (DUF4913)
MTPDPNPSTTTDPIGRELMRQAQLISQLRSDLNELTHGTTDIAADLLARLEDVSTGDSTSATRSWCWRDLGPKAADELWSQLSDWVAWLRTRYPLAKKVPPCWREHPEIVEELTALWLAWQGAYVDANAPLTGPAEWHDHWLPGLLRRLEHGPFVLNCSSEHSARPLSAYS